MPERSGDGQAHASEIAERVCSDAIQVHAATATSATFRSSASNATCASATLRRPSEIQKMLIARRWGADRAFARRAARCGGGHRSRRERRYSVPTSTAPAVSSKSIAPTKPRARGAAVRPTRPTRRRTGGRSTTASGHAAGARSVAARRVGRGAAGRPRASRADAAATRDAGIAPALKRRGWSPAWVVVAALLGWSRAGRRCHRLEPAHKPARPPVGVMSGTSSSTSRCCWRRCARADRRGAHCDDAGAANAVRQRTAAHFSTGWTDATRADLGARRAADDIAAAPWRSDHRRMYLRAGARLPRRLAEHLVAADQVRRCWRR